MNEFQCRRARFFDQMNENSVAVFSAEIEKMRNNDAEYRFRQDSNFYYLSGLNEPDACLVLIKNSMGQKAILFNHPKDKQEEIWNGYRLGQSGAVSLLHFDEAYSLEQLQNHLYVLLDGMNTLYFSVFYDDKLDDLLKSAINELRVNKRKGMVAPTQFVDSLPILHEMRLIKSEAEIALLSEAAEISAAGHVRAMQECRPGMWEYQLQSEVEYEFAQQGAREMAYNSIVAGGENACILHYTNNNCQLRDGQLVLIDAGAEYQGYAGDITRTFPVNGLFSEHQAMLYQLVLDIQVSAISQVRPGVSLAGINNNAIKKLVEGLLELDILQGDSEQLIEQQAYKPFYMHGIGHYLGLDVHDVGDYGSVKQPRLLEEGMVVTIEPGLYIGHDADVAPEWKKIGIRIEDDVLVTASGGDVLTADVPKSINEIEALMANS